MLKNFKRAGLFVLSGSIIFLVYFASDCTLKYFGIKFPASLVGMMALFVLLCLKIIPLWAVEEASDFLLKYMMFFFLPLLVLLPDSYEIFKSHIWIALVILLISGFLTLSLTALCVDKFHLYKKSKQEISQQTEQSK